MLPSLRTIAVEFTNTNLPLRAGNVFNHVEDRYCFETQKTDEKRRLFYFGCKSSVGFISEPLSPVSTNSGEVNRIDLTKVRLLKKIKWLKLVFHNHHSLVDASLG